MGFGLLAFFIILYWPTEALWEKEMRCSSILGFSADEQTVIFLDNFTDRGAYQKDTPISFVASDTRTGVERRRMQFAIESDFVVANVSCSANYELVLFYGSRIRSSDNSVIKPDVRHPDRECVCFLYDLKTGQRIGGPWDCDRDQDVLLSPDGKWIFVSGLQVGRVISSSTGETVLKLDYLGVHGVFAKDSQSLAMFVIREGKWHVVAVDIPSGKEKYEVVLPDLSKEPPDQSGKPPRWRLLMDWDGHSLRAGTIFMKKSRYEHSFYQFEVNKSGMKYLGKQPEYRITSTDDESYSGFQHGDCIIYYLPGLATWPEWITTCMGWIDKSFKTSWVESQKNKHAMAFHDIATNQQRCVVRMNQFISEQRSRTGKYFTFTRNVQWPLCSIQVWDTDPPSRWLMAGGSGLMVALGLFWVRSLLLRMKTPINRWQRA